MSLITLSSDFGLEDPYVGIMKGVILGINPEVHLVDLTHSLSHHRLLEAAFVLHSAFSYFPKETIHLVVVDPGVGGDRRLIGIKGKEQYWIGPDNGLFSLVLKDQPEALVVHLAKTAFFLPVISATFHGRDKMAPVAAHLSLGVPLMEMGPRVLDPVVLPFPEPEITRGGICGQVLWSDHFGNLITNIHQSEILPWLSGEAPTIRIGSHCITRIHRHYSQGRAGEWMALFSSSGYLEIAFYLGKAAEKMNYTPGMDLTVSVTKDPGVLS